MIELDVNLSYLTRHFNINAARLNEYRGQTVDKIIEEEVKAGNKDALRFASIIKDPKELSELLALANVDNRYLIIRSLSEEDLTKVLEKLNSVQLAWGLNFFTQDVLMKLMNELPQEQLLEVVFQKFSLEDIVKLMPEDELDAFLKGPEIDRKAIMECFMQFNKQFLNKIMFEVTGQSYEGKSKAEIIKYMNDLDDDEFNRFVLNMDQFQKQTLTYFLCQNDNKLMLELDQKSISRPMLNLNKQDIVPCFEVLDPEFLIPMIEELPRELIDVVAAQIDVADFAELLLSEFPEVLKNISF
ncbi:hypothetical protein IJC60_00955 [bacterium]|nr:hypothetical protein [bacterium]